MAGDNSDNQSATGRFINGGRFPGQLAEQSGLTEPATAGLSSPFGGFERAADEMADDLRMALVDVLRVGARVLAATLKEWEARRD